MKPRSKRQCWLKGKFWGRRRTTRKNAQAWCRLFSKEGRVADKREIREQRELPPDREFRTLLPAGTPWTLSSIRIEGAVLWIVACIDEGDLWGPRLGVTLIPDPTVKATSRPVDAWVLFGHEPRVIGVLPNEVEAKVVEFIDRNLEALLGHWRGELDTPSCLERLEPFPL